MAEAVQKRVAMNLVWERKYPRMYLLKKRLEIFLQALLCLEQPATLSVLRGNTIFCTAKVLPVGKWAHSKHPFAHKTCTCSRDGNVMSRARTETRRPL